MLSHVDAPNIPLVPASTATAWTMGSERCPDLSNWRACNRAAPHLLRRYFRLRSQHVSGATRIGVLFHMERRSVAVRLEPQAHHRRQEGRVPDGEIKSLPIRLPVQGRKPGLTVTRSALTP